MAHDAFAQQGLGSSALVILAALRANPHQSAADLVATSAVSRATTYRTLRRLADLGLVEQTGPLWTLAPGALEGIAGGNSLAEAVTQTATSDLG
jgi:DNA-binding IclR family transcriptional regulator